MTVDNNENLIINIGGKTRCFNREEIEQAFTAQKLFCKEVKGADFDLDKIKPAYYNRYKITPLTFIMENDIDFVRGSIIKYILRFDAKNGIEDLLKAKEYLDQLINYKEKK